MFSGLDTALIFEQLSHSARRVGVSANPSHTPWHAPPAESSRATQCPAVTAVVGPMSAAVHRIGSRGADSPTSSATDS